MNIYIVRSSYSRRCESIDTIYYITSDSEENAINIAKDIEKNSPVIKQTSFWTLETLDPTKDEKKVLYVDYRSW